MADLFNNKYFYNLNKSAISQYENNKRIPDIQVLINISDFFDVSLDYLLKGTGTKDILLKEHEQEYLLTMDVNSLDIERLIALVPKILKENKISIGNKPLSEEQKKILLNSLESALYLIKREK